MKINELFKKIRNYFFLSPTAAENGRRSAEKVVYATGTYDHSSTKITCPLKILTNMARG